MKTFDFVLITTCDVCGERLNELIRLLTSIDAEIKSHGLRIRHFMLLQNTESLPQELNYFLNKQRTFMFVSHRVSLSRARNLILWQAKQDGIFQSAKLCAFPDDDAWYPPGAMALILKTYQSQPEIGVLTCDYGSQPISPSEVPSLVFEEVAKCGQFIKKVSSNTLFLRSSLVETVGYFDERLGVGGSINGGEDLDFALRAFRKSGHRVMIYEGLLVGHRDRLKWVRSTYFAGSLFAICRSAQGNFCLSLQCLRKIVVGAFLVFLGELSIKDYFLGLGHGLSGFFSTQPQVASLE